jgi:hypothetical protein
MEVEEQKKAIRFDVLLAAERYARDLVAHRELQKKLEDSYEQLRSLLVGVEQRFVVKTSHDKGFLLVTDAESGDFQAQGVDLLN